MPLGLWGVPPSQKLAGAADPQNESAVPRVSAAVLGPLGASWEHLGSIWGPLGSLLGRSWATLATYIRGPGVQAGASFSRKTGSKVLLPVFILLSLVALVAWSLIRVGVVMGCVGGPEPRFGPILAVWGCSWSLCWRSWVALASYIRGPAIQAGASFSRKTGC